MEKILDFVKNELCPLKKAPWDKEFVVSFPDNPDDLPSDIYRHAYADAPPGKHSVDSMDCPAFLRKNSMKLKSAMPSPVIVSPEKSPDVGCFAKLFMHMASMSSASPAWSMQYKPQALALPWHGMGQHGPPTQPEDFTQPSQSSAQAPDTPRAAPAHSTPPRVSPANSPISNDVEHAKCALQRELADEDMALREAMTANAHEKALVKKGIQNKTQERTTPTRATCNSRVRKRPASCLVDDTGGADDDAGDADASGARFVASPTPGTSVTYRGSKCYYSSRLQAYRVIVNPKLNLSDTCFSFKRRSEDDAWQDVLRFVDGHRV